MNDTASEKPVIPATDVANYVVCPEAWRLKLTGKGTKKHTERASEGKQLRKAWVETQDLSATLRKYAKVIYLLLVALVVVVFLLEYQRMFWPK